MSALGDISAETSSISHDYNLCQKLRNDELFNLKPFDFFVRVLNETELYIPWTSHGRPFGCDLEYFHKERESMGMRKRERQRDRGREREREREKDR